MQQTIQSDRVKERSSQTVWLLPGLLAVVAFLIGTWQAPDYANSTLGMVAFGIAACFLFIGITRLDWLVLALIALAPFHCLVRGLDEQNFLLTGWRDILFAGTIIYWVLWVGIGRLKFPSGYVMMFMIAFSLFGIIQATRADSTLLALSSYRDVFKYCMLFVVAQSLAQRNSEFIKRIAVCIFSSAVLAASIQVILYFTDQDYIVRLGIPTTTSRSLGALTFRRMEAFFGGGPSNLGIYLASAFAVYLAYRLSREKTPVWWNFGALLLVFSVIMTVSFTGVVGVFLAMAMMLARKDQKAVYWVLILGAFGFLFSVMNEGIGQEQATQSSMGDASNFFLYFKNVFFEYLFLDYARQIVANASVFTFGEGLGIVGNKKFLEGEIIPDVRILGNSDGGWAEFALQIGVPMTVLLLLTIGYILWKSHRNIKYLPVSLQSSAWALLGSGVAMLTSIHIVPWIRVGSDVNLWIVLGALGSLTTLKSRNVQMTTRPLLDWSDKEAILGESKTGARP